MNKIKPLDQDLPTGALAAYHMAKVQNNFDSKCSILDGLMDFASSVPDFRGLDKCNIRHRFRDIVMLKLRGRASGHVDYPTRIGPGKGTMCLFLA